MFIYNANTDWLFCCDTRGGHICMLNLLFLAKKNNIFLEEYWVFFWSLITRIARLASIKTAVIAFAASHLCKTILRMPLNTFRVRGLSFLPSFFLSFVVLSFLLPRFLPSSVSSVLSYFGHTLFSGFSVWKSARKNIARACTFRRENWFHSAI